MHNTKFLLIELRGILQTSAVILLSLRVRRHTPISIKQPHSLLYSVTERVAEGSSVGARPNVGGYTWM